jgi:hypothetical protein
MRSGKDSRIGSLSTRSEYRFRGSVHPLADPYQVYSISKVHRGCQLAPSQCTVCYILLMVLKPQDLCGQPGHLRWSGTAATSNEALCEVGNMPSQASTTGSSRRPSWRWQRRGTGSQKSFLLSQSVGALQRANSPAVHLIPINSVSCLTISDRSPVCFDVSKADTPCQPQPRAAAR